MKLGIDICTGYTQIVVYKHTLVVPVEAVPRLRKYTYRKFHPLGLVYRHDTHYIVILPEDICLSHILVVGSDSLDISHEIEQSLISRPGIVSRQLHQTFEIGSAHASTRERRHIVVVSRIAAYICDQL